MYLNRSIASTKILYLCEVLQRPILVTDETASGQFSQAYLNLAKNLHQQTTTVNSYYILLTYTCMNFLVISQYVLHL